MKVLGYYIVESIEVRWYISDTVVRDTLSKVFARSKFSTVVATDKRTNVWSRDFII